MTSALASQLQSIASLDANRLTSRGGYPSSKSYLFSPKEAASHDLDAIYSLGLSGFEELITIDPAFADFEDELFSEKAKRMDRMMLNAAENKDLDVVLEKCLGRLGRWIGVMAGGKCIEWLVRRFRVHEMNAEIVLQVFLPYHSSPNFARILAILTIPKESVYHVPFAPLVAKSQAIPRAYITNIISPEREKSLRLLQDVASMITVAHREGVVHRALLAFWSGIMVELLEKNRHGKGVGEGLVKVFVETFVELLSIPEGGKDLNAAVYPPLILLTRSIHLADEPFEAILSALLTPNSEADVSQRLLTLLVVLNDRKEWSSGLGADASEHLSALPELGGLLIATMEKYDFTKALSVICDVLLEQPQHHHKALNQIIDSSALPIPLAKAIATKALTVGSDSQTSLTDKAACRSLLSMLRERQPTIVDTAALEVPEVDSELIERPEEETTMLNLLSADVTARVDGINALLAPHTSTGAKDISDEESNTLRSSILSRLGDSDTQILDALYRSSKHRDVIARVCSPADISQALRPLFCADRIDEELLRRHLSFVCNNLVKVHPETKNEVFESLLFPILLSTKGRTLSAAAVEVIKNSTLGGTSETVKAVCTVDIASPADVSKSIAASVKNDSDSLIDFFFAQLGSPSPSSRLLSHLVITQLFLESSVDRVRLASLVLHQVSPLLNGPGIPESSDLVDPLSSSLISAIVNKPKAAKTWQLCTAALFAAMAKITTTNSFVSWLVAEDDDPFKDYANGIYKWANSSVLPTSLAAILLRSLFTQLASDTLLFLASVWTAPSASTALRVASMKHAAAFVQAHKDAKTDFQLVLPALLVGLQNADKSVRDGAVHLLKAINRVSQDGGDVHALDTIYGDRSDSVQLLKQSDLRFYLDALVAAADRVLVDRDQVALMHVEKLSYDANESKKDAAHRRAVVDALMSHVTAWQAIGPRTVLLRILGSVDDRSIFRGILPLITASASSEQAWMEALAPGVQDIYLSLLWETFRQQSAGVLQEGDAAGWKSIIGLLRNTSGVGAKLRTASLGRMQLGVFNGLSQQLKTEYVVALLQSFDVISTDEIFASKTVLASFKLDPATIVNVIEMLSQPLESVAQKKKAKHDEASGDKAVAAINQLTALIESRNWSEIPGSARLLASLLSLLSTLLAKRQSIKEGIDYLEQEILGAALAVSAKITDSVEIQRAHVGIEVIIKVIRASTNPRTSQRALLVASELARLIPEAVLHNAMPIFTFMGASELQRDDAYSFGVVEKTVERIVPVMTRSLRAKAKSKLNLYQDAKTFLSIFTDMASRLPKHRILPFFVHLVKSLGAEDFLAPISMLLVDRSTTKAGRGGGSVGQVMELPQSVASAFDVDTRLDVVHEVINEVGRLVDDTTREDKDAFLTHEADSDRLLRQLTALLSFAASLTKSLSGSTCDQSLAEAVVKSLLLLSSNVSRSIVSDSGVPAGVQACLGTSMQLLSASRFLGVIISLLGGESDQDISVALNILVERLPRIKPEIRLKSAQQVGDILKRVSTFVRPGSRITGTALSALHAIASSAQTTEDGALASIMSPLISQATKLSENADQVSLLSLLEVATRHLGSRVIPFIQGMVDTTLSLAFSSPSVVAQSFALQGALIDAVPTFVGSKQLLAILRNALNGKEGSRSVVVGASKKIATKTLFPVVMDLWKSIQNESADIMSNFFDLLRSVLKNADRSALPTLLKPIFAFFLDVFDLRHRLQLKSFDSKSIDEVENSAIGSFLELVDKLNEATFKPLFIRLYDWAVIDLSEGKRIDDGRLTERRIVLFRVMSGLLAKFKNILSPYMGTLLPHIEELLPAYQDGQITDEPLLLLLLDTLSKSFEVDEGAFWTDATHLTIIPLLVNLLDTPLSASSEISSHLASCLGSLAGSTTTEQVIKTLNTSICLSTRSDTVSTRLAALDALESIWTKNTDELSSFVQETVGEFLGELIEDENGDVEVKARKVMAKIESLTGDLKEYLD